MLFTPRCSPRAREFQRLVNCSLGRTVVELRGVKVSQFSDFGLFSPFKNPKTYLPVTSLQPRDYIAEWLRFFHVVVEGSKPRGAFRQRSFPATSCRGAGDPQTCPKFRLWQMAVPIQNWEFYYTARQIWTRDVWKCAILRTDVLSNQISSPLPQNRPKTPFWGNF